MEGGNSNLQKRRNAGATFKNIVKYVMDHSRITEDKARFLVTEVLKTGMVMGKIKKTRCDVYYLTAEKPMQLVRKIREPRFSDDSDDTLSDLSD